MWGLQEHCPVKQAGPPPQSWISILRLRCISWRSCKFLHTRRMLCQQAVNGFSCHDILRLYWPLWVGALAWLTGKLTNPDCLLITTMRLVSIYHSPIRVSDTCARGAEIFWKPLGSWNASYACVVDTIYSQSVGVLPSSCHYLRPLPTLWGSFICNVQCRHLAVDFDGIGFCSLHLWFLLNLRGMLCPCAKDQMHAWSNHPLNLELQPMS